MLVLSRKVGESIMIGDDIVITTIGINGGQVRLGITAPRDTAVHREEIYLKIKQQEEEDNKAWAEDANQQ